MLRLAAKWRMAFFDHGAAARVINLSRLTIPMVSVLDNPCVAEVAERRCLPAMLNRYGPPPYG